MDSSRNEGNEGLQMNKHAWKKPSSDPISVGSVMGAVLWPALSESARVQTKPTDSGSPLGEGSSASEASAMQQSLQKSHQNANANPPQNHSFPNRQRSFNRRGNNASGRTVFSVTEPSLHNEQTQKDTSQKNNWDSGSRVSSYQCYNGDDRPSNSYRRGSGQHPRSEPPHQNNIQGNRGNARYQWNPNRGNGCRYIYHQQRIVPSNFVPPLPPPPPPPFFSAPLGFGPPIGYPDMGSQVYYVPAALPDPAQGAPFIPYAPPFVSLLTDPNLPAKLVKQIDHYFSPENLCKDVFLRKNMDEQGWVDVSLIANFNMVKQLTFRIPNSIPFILDCLRGSSAVEIQGRKIRKHDDWEKWLLPRNSPSSSDAGSSSVSSIDSLATRIKGVSIDQSKVTSAEAPVSLSRSSSDASQSLSYHGDDRADQVSK